MDLHRSQACELACPGIGPESALGLGPDKDVALDDVGQQNVAVVARLAEGEDGRGGADLLPQQRQGGVPCIKTSSQHESIPE